jgi:hypothetical protein
MMHQFDYKAIILLNNCSISMMERSCYEQAYATLRNAIDVYKLLIQDDGDGDEQAYELINDKLNQSLKQISNPVQSARTILPLHVVSHTQAGLNTSNVMIRINDTEHDDLLEDDSKAPLLPMVIVFYNIAVVLMFLGDNVNNRHSWKKFFLGMSFQLASNCFAGSSNPFVMYRAVNLATIVLQTLPEGEDDDLHFHLIHIRTVANRFEDSVFFHSLTNGAAAAAAATA